MDHISAVNLPAAIAAEMSGNEGHDLIEYVAPLPQFEPGVLDLTDIVEEATRRHGDQLDLARRYSYNPTTNVFYGFCHGYAPDPGDYRRGLWDQVGLPNGPATWQELLERGTRIRQELGIQMGIGMSAEDDSNMSCQALLMAFGASVQDENENVVINSPETVAEVEYMKSLFDGAMTPEVFGWNPASNNQLLIAGQASYILNSISAYRSAQTAQPEVAADIFFAAPLAGQNGIALANGDAVFVYMIPTNAEYPDTAKEFLLHLPPTMSRQPSRASSTTSRPGRDSPRSSSPRAAGSTPTPTTPSRQTSWPCSKTPRTGPSTWATPDRPTPRSARSSPRTSCRTCSRQRRAGS
ncbi:MAG: extracellular solute-binding protein [Thermomicrobiales bacterium]